MGIKQNGPVKIVNIILIAGTATVDINHFKNKLTKVLVDYKIWSACIAACIKMKAVSLNICVHATVKLY